MKQELNNIFFDKANHMTCQELKENIGKEKLKYIQEKYKIYIKK